MFAQQLDDARASALHRLRNLQEWTHGLAPVLVDELSATLSDMLLEESDVRLRWLQARAATLEELISLVDAEATKTLERFAQSGRRANRR